MGSIRMGPPIELVAHLRNQFGLRTFVETGTYLGKTAIWAAQHFDHVFTIEFSESLFREVSQKYKGINNLIFLYGDTRFHLRSVLAQQVTPCLIWLDAHWSGGYTYGVEDECPLLEELAIIGEQNCDHFILIDDARLFLAPPPPPHNPAHWPTLAEVITTLQTINPQSYIVIIEDVIISVPEFAKETVVQLYHSSLQRPNPNRTVDPSSLRTSLLDVELRVIEQFIQGRQVVFDVGANRGDWSKHVIAKHPEVTIHMFEPLPDLYQELLATFSAYFPRGLILPNNLAVSSRSETRTFYRYPMDKNTLSTFYRRIRAEGKSNLSSPKEIMIRTTTLDEYCQHHKICRIHFLKIDVEGAEKDVLQGAQNLIKSGKIDFIQFEYGGTYLDAGITLEDVYRYLTQHRYSIFKISHLGLEYRPDFLAEYETYDYSNYLAINERLIDLVLNRPKSMLNLQELVTRHEINPKGVIHIGAHVGKELNTYQSMGVERVVFVEANPHIYEQLKQRIEGQSGVTAFNYAISDQNGNVDLHITSNSQSSSILPLKFHQDIYPDIKEIQTITVPSSTLDNMLNEHQLDPSNYTLLNIDIQGAELLALQGAKDCLTHIEAINVEVNYEELYEGCVLIDELDTFLETHGFRRVATKCPYHHTWGDAFYVRVPTVTMSQLGEVGRFANQLFQYMFLRLYAKRYDLEYAVPDWVGQRLFKIDDPPIKTQYLLICDWSHYLDNSTLHTYGKPSASLDICGYFQYHTSYYQEHMDFIRSLFMPKDEIRAVLDTEIARIRSRGKTLVGLHLRRGDYLRGGGFGHRYFFVAPSAWYLNWLDGLWETLDQPILYVASDDIDTVVDDFKDYNPITFKDLSVDLSVLKDVDYFIDFYILSQCDLTAISNSTFSFFATMLNTTGWGFFRPELYTQKLIPYSPWQADPLLKNVVVSRDESNRIHISKVEKMDSVKRLILIALPDWHIPAEELYGQLSSLVRQILNMHNRRQVTLVLTVLQSTDNDDIPDPETMVNDVILNLLLESEELQTTQDLPTIRYCYDVAPSLWDMLISTVDYRIPLASEFTGRSSLWEKISTLPVWR